MPFLMGLIFSLVSSWLYLSWWGSEIHSSLYIVNPNPIEVLRMMIEYKAREELAILVVIAVVAFIIGAAVGSLFTGRRVRVVQNTNGASNSSGGVQGIVCPDCGIINDVEDNFCPKCGHKFRLKCPSCGEFNDKDSGFCRKCGSKLEA